MKNHKHIIFCEEHYNPLGIVRSLGEAGINPIGVIIKSKKRLTSKSKYWSKVHLVDSIMAGFKLILNEYGNEDNKPFIYTSDDTITSLLDHNYELLKDRFIFFNAGTSDRISNYMNKDAINNLAIKHGLNVLDAVVVEHGVIPDNLEYPVITKSIASTVGGWKKDVHICHSSEELKTAYDHIEASTVLIQKYIEKKNELCIDGFSISKGQECYFTIASNYTYILPNTYSSQMIIYNLDNSDLENKLKRMLEEVEFEGIFSIEFLVDENDELYFCEINFRNSTWSYASTCAGMNLPYLWASGMIEKLDRNKIYKTIPAGFNAMVEINDFKDRVLAKRISFFKWIKQLKGSNCRFYLGKHDIKPVFSLFCSTLVTKVLKNSTNL